MDKLDKLTPEQEVALIAHRAEWFGVATSTAPADRPRAEAAARELAELGGVHVQHIIWVDSPEGGDHCPNPWHEFSIEQGVPVCRCKARPECEGVRPR